MKTIGLLGGMSWESTVSYYRIINQLVNTRLGGMHSAKIVLSSVNFAPIVKCHNTGEWDLAGSLLSEAALSIQAAGADFLVLCTNTMHKVAPQIEASLQIPLLHIADATAEALAQDGVKKVGLLGTSFTMEQDFYKGRLALKHGLETLIPEAKDRAIVHGIINQELCKGLFRDPSKEEYLRIIDTLAERGAEAVILGCTKIGLLITQTDTETKLYDTTLIHATRAVEYAMQSGQDD